MRSLKIVSGTMMLLFSSQLFAGWTSTDGEVLQVFSHNGFHLVKTNIPASTCSTSGHFWWPADDPDADDMLSIALAAFMSGKKVGFVHNTDTPECLWNNWNKATHIRISH
ncbi:hypothetical protein [Alteromonas sp. KUL49]|uniref:hypothetical protein n=1 Tax=Alteromonas sp. KUL49 TaxID=2480798 RepID=UPI00102F02CC|nr:hypothetical protein [Alteromonas sp. KUL49]TAP39710.1 hypothetical protein EYS00_10295 [Alteromonas sp. KUL49]GEA11700.1 hypothetical protein KUL49_20750 [Alteromonas sp. KUL49]